MRLALPLFAASLALAGCAGQSEPVASAPPSVSYRVPGNNVAATNAEAQNYCATYGQAAQYQGVREAPGGAVAVYTCDGGSKAAVSGGSVPPGPAVAGPQCADALHQDRPGGTDYQGPAVIGCPQR